MKNSKKYSPKIKAFPQRAKRSSGKIEKIFYDEPLDAIVHAIISENMTMTKTVSAAKRLSGYFVDWNDLRVSKMNEITEVLGTDMPDVAETSSRLTRFLRAVFEKYNTVSLEPLKKMGKRSARAVLENMDGATGFVVNYCMLTALDAHAVPLTSRMIKYLKTNELVNPEADDEQIEGFLTRCISCEDACEFYILLRRNAERSKPAGGSGRVKKGKKATVRKGAVAKIGKTKKSAVSRKKKTKKDK